MAEKQQQRIIHYDRNTMEHQYMHNKSVSCIQSIGTYLNNPFTCTN